MQFYKVLVPSSPVDITLILVVFKIVTGHPRAEHRKGIELVAHQGIDIERVVERIVLPDPPHEELPCKLERGYISEDVTVVEFRAGGNALQT